MKRRQFISLPLLVLFLTLTSTVLASNTWYVDGVIGSDANDCQSALTACRKVGNAISLASSDDSIMVASATYNENLNIGTSLNVIGSGAQGRSRKNHRFGLAVVPGFCAGFCEGIN